jgi:hypothetical protein
MPQRLTEVPLKKLVPTALPWNEGKETGVWEWRYLTGDYSQAIAYGELFWPDFQAHDGCVLWAEGFDESNYNAFMEQTSGNRRAVEAVMNHVHIAYLFDSLRVDPTTDQMVYLGRLLREIWSVKLRHDFPDRRFVVHFEEDSSEDDIGYEITFYQSDHNDPTP